MGCSLNFGGYRFEVDTGRLWAGTREVRVTPKASAVLKVLVTHAGQPVSKEDLFRSVWSDTAVTDDALTSSVALLGTVDEVCDTLVERRERWGVSYVVVGGDAYEAFAPVVARLAGT